MIGLALSAIIATSLQVAGSNVTYQHAGTTLEGYVAKDTSWKDPRPVVLIVHDWNGIDDYEMRRAREIASLGYIGFAIDIYGKGVRPKNAQESAAEAGKYRGAPDLFRARLKAGMEFAQKMNGADPSKIGAMGYCFGGGGVLELARSGAPVLGVVSFHGSLGTKDPTEAKNIKGKVLVLHGADDPFVPDAQVAAFMKEMRDASVDYQFVSYGGAVHSFTEPNAGSNKASGAAYDANADKRSWSAMREFFKELFGK
ncbi:MAG TPA: dienelactone hydrolase family protein [Fimbriimonadaceae bacterium]|nr:dienelactone hydrolase family protein [Fimbriimonadaceae bacterium]